MKKMMLKAIDKILLLIIFATNLAYGQVDMSEKQKNEFLKDLVLSFESEFLWKEKGEQIAKQLYSKINNGDYSNISEADIFVETLNRDLFVLSNDLHLTVDLYYPKPEEPANTSHSTNTSIFEKELINDGIYYLKFDDFPKLNAKFEKEVEDLMTSFEGLNTIIIDLRNNSGGSDETVNHLMGYFFEEKTKLATSYQWNSQPQEIWAFPNGHSQSLSKAKLIILTSQSTFSAAEIFTQRLQLHERAIVIGEPTPGAAHRTETYLMSDIFLLHWPYEQSKHVRGEKDLEGIGITPDSYAHYNNTKKEAVKFAEDGKISNSDNIEVPKETNLITALYEAINSRSNDKAFISKHVLSENQNQVLGTLNKFKTVWNHNLDAELINIHYLNEDNFRIFFKTSYGTIQMKIIVDDHKIARIIYRL